MDYLREGIGLRSMASRDPLVEYQREGAGMFATMMDSVMEEVVAFLFHLQVSQVEQPGAPSVTLTAGGAGQAAGQGDLKSGRGKATGKGRRRPSAGAGAGPEGAGDASPEEDASKSRQRSALEAEAAAARSEFHLTSTGLPAAPATTTAVSGPAARPLPKTDGPDLRASRPGAAGRRNQGKKKRR
jgi:preprotein translocase subunit SecA